MRDPYDDRPGVSPELRRLVAVVILIVLVVLALILVL